MKSYGVCDKPVGHLGRGVDDGLAAGRALTDPGKHLVEGVDELSQRLDRFEHVLVARRGSAGVAAVESCEVLAGK
jgi:hypothetical protein